MSRFRERLRSTEILLMDGAMGTEIERAGIQLGECCELWNLRHPERVQQIHRAYVNAGASCLVTNTFQGNPRALARHGLLEDLETINQAGIDIARSVAGVERFVLASVGPLDAKQYSLEAFERTARSLRMADALLLETWSSCPLDSLAQARRAIWNPQDLPVVLSIAFRKDPKDTSSDHCGFEPDPERAADWANACGAAVLGVNCGRDIGLDEMVEVLRSYRRATALPLLARPNAGTPQRVAGQWVYPHTPIMMASRVVELLQVGVKLLGGCCGTTPEHIAAFRPMVEEWHAR